MTALDPVRDAAARTQLQRLARQLTLQNRRVIALLPAGARVAIAPLALHLGEALAECSGALVTLLDANTKRPAFSAALARLATEEDGGASFLALKLTPHLRIVAPRARPEIGMGVLAIGRVLQEARRAGGFVLVDLSGYAESGEHWEGLSMVDGALTLARAGRTTEAELLAAAHSVPEAQSLGVLLLG